MQDAPSVLNPMSERRTTLLGATLTMIGPLSMAIYTPAMPELVHAFGTTDSAIKLTLSLYFAGFACAQLISGPCSDAFGRGQRRFPSSRSTLSAASSALSHPPSTCC